MRPDYLKLRGFITYKEEVEIDFKKFQEDKIFMICGPTGSGKTSLFDAVCFALYGEVSTDVRGSDESLRCDFLTPEDPETFVEFSFYQGEEKYRILRYPAQYRKRRTGNITMESSRAELYKGDAYVDLGRVKEVNEEIQRIIGLTRDQFTKILMLPQGEFARFLSSSSKEKEGILRKIFGTGQYEAFGLEIKSRKDQAEKALDALRMGADHLIENLDEETKNAVAKLLNHQGKAGPESYGEIKIILEAEEEKARGEAGKLEEKLEYTQKIIEKKQKEHIQAEETNGDFLQLQQIKKDLVEAESRKSQEENLREEILLAKKALEIRPLEDARERTKKKVDQLSAERRGKEELHRILNQKIKEWEKDHTALEERQENLDRLKEQGIKLKGELEIFLEMKKRENMRSEKVKAFMTVENTLKEKEQEIKKEIHQLEILNRVEEDLLDLQKSRQSLTEQIHSNGLAKHDLKILMEWFEEKNKKEEEQQNYQLGLQEDEREEKQMGIDLDKMEKSWHDQGLYPYAQDLKENQPCPLCGSTDHPHPLKIHEGIAQRDLEQRRKQLHAVTSRILAAKEGMQIREKEITRIFSKIQQAKADKWMQIQSVNDVQEQQKRLQEDEIKNMKREKEMAEQETHFRKLRQDKKNLEVSHQKKTQELYDLELHRNTLFQQIADLENRLKEDKEKTLSIVDQKDTENKLQELRNGYLRLEKEIKAIVEEGQKIKIAMSKSIGELGALEKNILEENQRLEVENKEFQVAYAKAFSSFEAYGSVKEKLRDLLDKEEENAAFFKKLEEGYQKIGLLQNKLQGKVIVDLKQLIHEIQELRRTQKMDQDNIKSIQLRLSRLGDWMNQMSIFAIEGKEALHQKQIASELYALCRGDNPRKLSFETYVLLWYFDDVLEYANQRLYQISSGRYELNRKEENQKERGQNKGLEIAVLDTNTGKERSASTLSGGESFLVSLSLALGLSDAMAGEVGGVEVGALFIDEGFGTLDQDKLQNAVDCLVQLTDTNRLIGIISHVEELKESIPGKIIVTYHRETGSHVKIEV